MPRRPEKTSQERWPRDGGPHRRLLELLDGLREDDARPTYEQIALRMRLPKSRVSEVLTATRGALPADQNQVALFVRVLGGGEDEVALARRYLREIKARSGDLSNQPASAPRVTYENGPRTGAHRYVARPELEERYREIKATGSAVVVLAGPPGIGKTTLATHLAGEDHHVIRCGSELNLIKSLRAYLPTKTGKTLSALPQLEDAFRTRLRSRPPLRTIVFDDIQDDDQLRRLLPEELPGSFIVTSRRRISIVDPNAYIAVDPLSKEQAGNLVSLLLDSVQPGDVQALAEAVGYHPLALEAVCGRLVQDGTIDTAEWIGELRADAVRLLEQPATDGQPGLALSYRDICEDLRTGAPLAFRLLGLITFAADGPLETAILLNALHTSGKRPLRGKQTSRVLGRQSLTQLRDVFLIRSSPVSGSAVEMHDFTRRILRDILLEERPAFVADLHDAVIDLLAANMRGPRSQAEVLELLPQLLQFGRHLMPGASREPGMPQLTSLLDGFEQSLLTAAQLLMAIGQDPSDFYLVAFPGGSGSYSLAACAMPPPDELGRRTMHLQLDVPQLRGWAPEGDEKVGLILRSATYHGPDGPVTMHGMVARYSADR